MSADGEGWEALGGVSAHAWRSQAEADVVRERILPYLGEHRREMAGHWLDWVGDDAMVVVAFTADVDRHRAVLEPLGARVVHRQHREDELDAIALELFAFADGLDDVTVQGTWGDSIQGKAFLEAITRDPDALRAALRARFGETVELDWLGADEYAVAARFTATATLNRPLAGRTVIDATTGNAVACGRAADWPDEEPELEPAGRLLQNAIALVWNGADAEALELFDQLAAQQPDAFDDPTIARKRRLAQLRLKRHTDA